MTDQQSASSQRVAIVTGAGKGLGKAYVLALAQKGFAVVVNNRVHAGVPSSAQAVVDEINAAGGTAIAHGGAVDNAAAAADLIQTTLDRFGRIDALVCNAGIMPQGPFADFDLDLARQLIEVNVLGAIYPLQPAWRHMVAAGYGRVVLTGSTVGMYGHGTVAVYGATRSAVIGLARSLAQEAPKGSNIGVNVILPLAYTDMAAQQMGAEMGAVLPAEKVAAVVAWLCEPRCTVTGAIFHAGGGRVSRVGIVESASIPVEDLDMAAMSGGALDLVPGNEASKPGQASERMITGKPLRQGG